MQKTPNTPFNTLPEKQGLYDPANEHDSCGVGFVAHIKGEKSHSIIQQGLTILKRVTHIWDEGEEIDIHSSLWIYLSVKKKDSAKHFLQEPLVL